MSFGRVLLALVVLGAGWWIARSQHWIGPAAPEGERAAPIDRARAAAATEKARNAETEAAAHAVEAPSGGRAVSENMTPDQVRDLLGPPDSMDSSTTETGVAIEKWTYRSVGKTVVFENGIVARVE